MLNSVAGATTGDLSTVLNAFDSLPNAAAVQDAYKQISPEKAGALADLGFVAANFRCAIWPPAPPTCALFREGAAGPTVLPRRLKLQLLQAGRGDVGL